MLGPQDLNRFIKENGLDAQLVPVAEGHTSDLAADSLKIELEAIAKTVVFINDGGMPVLAIVRGAVRIRQGEFTRILGMKKLRLATPEEVLTFTGFPAGGVSPIANLCRKNVFMDEELLKLSVVYAGGGSEKYILRAKPQDILVKSGATLMQIPVLGLAPR